MKNSSQNPFLAGIQNIIWLQTSFIGDLILTTGAFSLIKTKMPAINQILMTTPIGSACLKGQSYLDEIIVWDKRQSSILSSALRIRSHLRSKGVQPENSILVQVHKSTRSTLLTWLLGFRVITYDETNLAYFAKWTVPRVAVLHEVARIGMLLEPLGFAREEIVKLKPVLNVGHLPDKDWYHKLLKAQEQVVVIGIAPGSVWGTKRWPMERFAELTSKLMEQTTAYIVLLGSKNERLQADEIIRKNASFGERILDLVGVTALEELPAVYAKLRLLISNDSSPIHYASALNVPTIALFGATVPALGFGPLAEGSKVAEIEIEELACRPCSDHGPQVCPLGHFRCMLELKTDGILKMVRQFV